MHILGVSNATYWHCNVQITLDQLSLFKYKIPVIPLTQIISHNFHITLHILHFDRIHVWFTIQIIKFFILSIMCSLIVVNLTPDTTKILINSLNEKNHA